ncbi:aldehyde dehydrogenase (NADP(+)) [Mangrovicella endophytica]|uniref:aldehyde dehydrogenase (NADP(+)) n=1 Tax=Mangrovicella endophytica TaxID=2066697 RepID=UPI000C9DE587|nr:aldehyde dehydrogenase (NADP(+)) [Mangrovicella endophytica]
MDITGDILIGDEDRRGGETFRAVDPAADRELEPAFSVAGPAEVDAACSLAEAAFDSYRETDLETRARFLEAIASRIEALRPAFVERTTAESGLPPARIEGETARTAGQLRLFADVVRQGNFLDLRVDPAMPDRKPLPRPDLRQRHIPLGPVAVFGASNFPLAFSVAGGDTASALAAGCPVVVKGHPAHPGTSELVGRAIREAARECGLPAGVFSLLQGTSNELGGALVRDPRIKAVGFTGSRGGGLALVRIAQERPEPIPVYAEMSSINPVFLLPGALEEQAEALGAAFVGSLIMGAGQFCTNPGIGLAKPGAALDRFIAAATAALKGGAAAPMLTRGIGAAYRRSVEAMAASSRVEELARGLAGESANACQAALFAADASAFLADERLRDEIFGASSLIVRCDSDDDMVRVAAALEGQLTATLHLTAADYPQARRLIPILEKRAGRILVGGWPTGVEVGHAMVHGGPFPATSDGRSTSVGSLAIRRFLRPVCYQALPDELLPEALREANAGELPRRVDGRFA